MGRLFWKLFLSFWLTLLLAGVGVGVMVWLHRPASSVMAEMPVVAGGPARIMVDAGSSVAAAGGLRALRALLAAQPANEPFPLYAVDAAGDELLGRPVSAAALAAARRLADAGRPHASARRITLGDGRRLLLFVLSKAEPDGGPPPRSFGGQPPDWPHQGGYPADQPPPQSPGGHLPDRPGHHDGPPPWLLIGTGLIASLLFSALLAWYMAKPVRYLRRAFEAAAAGNLDVRVQPLIGRRRDEIADLGRDYDRMADRLRDLIEAQRRLFHDVSHELRSPLARLQAAIGLIRQNGNNMGTAVERVEREAGRLDELIGELLLYARLGSGTPASRTGTVDLSALIDDIVDDARFEAGTRGCRIELRGAGPLMVVGHADLLGRAIENVIRNALKYTAPASTVSVDVRCDAGGLLLCVGDRGPGVAPEALAAIFEPFYRARGADGYRGYGLGLAIARRAIEAHGGTITARNRPEGGLLVEIRLPLAAEGTSGE